MRIVALCLVGVALIAAAFGLGRVTRASANDPVKPRALSTPVPLDPGQPVSASGLSKAASLPALRPAPRRPKPARRPSSGPAAPSATAAPPAATAAPSSPRPSTPAPSTPKPKKPSAPVEEIG